MVWKLNEYSKHLFDKATPVRADPRRPPDAVVLTITPQMARVAASDQFIGLTKSLDSSAHTRQGIFNLPRTMYDNPSQYNMI
jgi:hypothetical protein